MIAPAHPPPAELLPRDAAPGPAHEPESDATDLGVRRPFLAAEFERMFAEGILGDEERLELLEGEIVRMSPIGSDHHLLVARLARMLARGVGEGDLLVPQGGLRIDDVTDVHPDLMIQRDVPIRHSTGLPKGADVSFAGEVSDSSLRYDLGEKAALYARAGVAEYWVVDARKDRVVVHREPSATGYRSLVERRAPETIAPVAFPDALVDLSELFR